MRAERLRRLLVARRDLLAEIGEARRTAGSASASTIAALSLATMSFGVPFGTQRPCQTEM